MYTDISWAPTGEKSQEASLHFIGSPGVNRVAWHSTKQDLTAQSTCEAERIAATSGTARGLPLTYLLEECRQGRVLLSLGADYLPSIRQVHLGIRNPLRTRHLSIRAYRLSEMVKAGELELYHVATTDTPADHLTKALTGNSASEALTRLGMRQ